MPFTLQGPTDLPSGYRLNQITIEEFNELDDKWDAWLMYISESGDRVRICLGQLNPLTIRRYSAIRMALMRKLR